MQDIEALGLPPPKLKLLQQSAQDDGQVKGHKGIYHLTLRHLTSVNSDKYVRTISYS